MRVAVVGAGVLGAAVAFRLAQSGAEVVLVDRDQPGSGTSSATFAWLNSNEKQPRDYYELNLAGMREHARLAAELGAAPWLRSGGNLEWRTDAGQLAEKVRRLRSWGYTVEWLDPADARGLASGLHLPDSAGEVAFFPDEGWIDAALLAREFTDLAARHGATVHVDTAVAGIILDRDAVSAVTLDNGGAPIPIDALVNAAGTDADTVAKLAGLPLPLAPTSGVLVRLRTAPGTAPLDRVVHAPEVNLRPDGPGRVLIHHDSTDELLRDGAKVDDLASTLVERARRVLPALADATVDHVGVGVRPMPRDGYPCVGPVRTRPGYFEAVTHSGATLAPLLGRLLARRIRTGEVDPLLSPYSPDRFSRD